HEEQLQGFETPKITLSISNLSEALPWTLKSIFLDPQHSSPDLLKPSHLFADAVNRETSPVLSSDVITRLVEVPDLSSDSSVLCLSDCKRSTVAIGDYHQPTAILPL
ncbi:hypothetical protein NPIL_251881, partial [Nephila pilipes]